MLIRFDWNNIHELFLAPQALIMIKARKLLKIWINTLTCLSGLIEMISTNRFSLLYDGDLSIKIQSDLDYRQHT